MAGWSIRFTSAAAKAHQKLPERVQLIVVALVADLRAFGPALYGRGWSHFGKLHGRADQYHCHLKGGRPTYVACWEVVSRSERIIEVNYVGTHEKAPY